LLQKGCKTISSHSFGVGMKSNVYDGESLALMAGMQLTLQYCKNNLDITTIHFYSDSSSALSNILKTNAHPSQTISLTFINSAQSFLEDNTHHIVLQWVPGHAGHDINEHADKLAQWGCHLKF
jgi:ribonuclease HI